MRKLIVLMAACSLAACGLENVDGGSEAANESSETSSDYTLNTDTNLVGDANINQSDDVDTMDATTLDLVTDM